MDAIVKQKVAIVNFLRRGKDSHQTMRQLHEPLRLRNG
jgi:hypothetical protein